jgi:hypothetical protein
MGLPPVIEQPEVGHRDDFGGRRGIGRRFLAEDGTKPEQRQ